MIANIQASNSARRLYPGPLERAFETTGRASRFIARNPRRAVLTVGAAAFCFEIGAVTIVLPSTHGGRDAINRPWTDDSIPGLLVRRIARESPGSGNWSDAFGEYRDLISGFLAFSHR